MSVDVLMPHLSEATQEGILVTWFVAPGAAVREGDLVAEVQVEKMSAEVRAPAAGLIGELRIAAGDVVAQGGVLATILDQAEPQPAVAAGRPLEGAAAGGPPAEGRAPVSPAARRLARELGVDLAAIAGSGTGGRITEADVQASAAARSAGAGAAPDLGPTLAPGAVAPAAGEIVPISPMRRAIGDRLRGGLLETAQLTLTARADVTDLADRLGLSAASDRRGSYVEAAVRACALAIRERPRIAARWTDDGLALPGQIDVGVAVALDDGLVVPVVRAADGKTVEQIGLEVADLADRARAGRLSPGETDGAVFSVTNLGRYRIEAFTPLLNPPQAAILGLGRAGPEPAVVAGSIVVRTMLVLSLTFDHRVLDGAPAAAFLTAVVDLLEAPERL